jgi:cyclopropane fatty-acyl-phospholipid synthase-like methyltransferase
MEHRKEQRGMINLTENKSTLYEGYFDSIYARSNALSTEEYENSAREFDVYFGRLMPEEQDAPILEIGCGTGHFLYYLKKRGYTHFLGIDISASQVEFCREGITPNVQHADVFEFLAGRKGSYTVISSSDVIEHIPKEKVISLLTLVHEALTPGGILLLKLPNMSNPFSLDSRYRDFTHECGFTEESIYQVLYTAGFRSIRICSSHVFTRTLKSFVNRIFTALFHALLRKLFWHQGMTAPKILSCRLIVSAKKEE